MKKTAKSQKLRLLRYLAAEAQTADSLYNIKGHHRDGAARWRQSQGLGFHGLVRLSLSVDRFRDSVILQRGQLFSGNKDQSHV